MESLKNPMKPQERKPQTSSAFNIEEVFELTPSARSEFFIHSDDTLFYKQGFYTKPFKCPKALIYLRLSQSMELDIALYNL